MYNQITFIFTILVLSASSTEYQRAVCREITDCNQCLNSMNNQERGIEFESLLDMDVNLSNDVTKCIPTKAEKNRGLTCDSWDRVQDKVERIDYECGQSLLSEQDHREVEILLKMADWNYNIQFGFVNKSDSDLIIRINDTHEVYALITYDESIDEVIVVFRGSANIENWLLNFNLVKEDYPDCENCEVHRGFLIGYNSLQVEVQKEVKLLMEKYGKRKVVVSGYSLGGAMAVLCALDMRKQTYDVDLYTLGQPRVGNVEFVEYLNYRINGVNLRGVYRNDPVPGVPQTTPRNFSHGGSEIHFLACDSKSYLGYPKLARRGVNMDLLEVEDHAGYFCLNQTNPESTASLFNLAKNVVPDLFDAVKQKIKGEF